MIHRTKSVTATNAYLVLLMSRFLRSTDTKFAPTYHLHVYSHIHLGMKQIWSNFLWRSFRVFSYKSRFEMAMTNCNKLQYLNYRVCTRESRLRRFCGLAFQSGDKKRGSFLCFSEVLIALSFEIEFLLENARFIGGGSG